MSKKNTIVIICISIIAYFIFRYFNIINGSYIDYIDLLPLPTHVTYAIKFISKHFNNNKDKPSGKNDEIRVNNQSNNNNDNKYTSIKTTKRNITNTEKKIVASNQQWKCNICHNILDYTYEVDHIKALYQGGDNNLVNLQALCRNCHGKKTVLERFN